MQSKTLKSEKGIPADFLYSPRAAKIVRTKQMTANEKFFEIRFDDGEPLGISAGTIYSTFNFRYR